MRDESSIATRAAHPPGHRAAGRAPCQRLLTMASIAHDLVRMIHARGVDPDALMLMRLLSTTHQHEDLSPLSECALNAYG